MSGTYAYSSPSGHPDGDQEASSAFGQLDQKVQRWIWRQGWTGLRDIQERSIPILLDRRRDLIVAAGTASGKTEAAFLPIVSRLAGDARTPGEGFEAIYISPLRALINDQFGRIEGLCEELDIPVTKWHGDVSASVKKNAAKRPRGILLTTPESVEAILCRRGPEAARLFRALGYIVVDELHAFMDAPRGKHLQSLLNRLEAAAGHDAVRVGLSATLADMRVSAAFLRPADPDRVTVLESASGAQSLLIQLRGYVEPDKPARGPAAEGSGPVEAGGVADDEIARHLFETLRGRRSLVFAGSRRRVELLTENLTRRSEALGVPNEFLAHHGSLSREHREDSERRMKDPDRPASIVCTTTLELGIDIGHIESVAQWGPGQTVSGMRQRVGRSGRREGQSSVMRVYVKEAQFGERLHPLDALRRETVQSVAMLNLMLRRWNEPPVTGRLHLSTLLHQILALIAQHGGLTAAQGWDILCASGVFAEAGLGVYKALLRRMAAPEIALLEQAPDGTLLPGAEGERVIAGRDFYAVFKTPDEYKVVTDAGRILGSIPVEIPYIPGQLIIFGGRNWRVTEVDPQRREIVVTSARGGKPPTFGGDELAPADGVISEMRAVYSGGTAPAFLDRTAADLLREGRETFTRLGLHQYDACRHSDMLLLFPWVGGRAQNAFLLSLGKLGLKTMAFGIAVGLPAEEGSLLIAALRELAAGEAPDAVELASLVPDKERAKFDRYLGAELLSLCYASEMIDAGRVPAIAAGMLGRLPPFAV